ncbi:hypothetical protein B0T21DRAFT_423400 [Apiosordaria backusii]|uniref:Uncharacterized protein n=1 Tax=Apiosordaria backusii TaxID=314023 RepID=A0AA40AXV2_9PEZI|nr:hypothetical protein B0T21DRAFT_423400 [Apiosordaria backusii]
MSSLRCRQPLTFLGQMYGDCWDTLVEQIRSVQIPGEAVEWNCQEYVIDIWDAMQAAQIINEQT